jgi:hypothetical protein
VVRHYPHVQLRRPSGQIRAHTGGQTDRAETHAAVTEAKTRHEPMKAFIFCTSYIKDQDAWACRYQRWLNYYDKIPIVAEKKIMIDDGSPFSPPREEIEVIHHSDNITGKSNKNLLVRFDDNLGRQSLSAYPGWWRSFLHSLEIAKNLSAGKIIHIESDAYVLSPRLVNFINTVDSGWHVLWAQRYALPETAIQVICRDQFPAFEQFRNESDGLIQRDIAERLLPFTSVGKQFKGDRYSEFKRNRGIFRSQKFNRIPIFQHDFFWEPIPADADFASQVVGRQKIEFRLPPA